MAHVTSGDGTPIADERHGSGPPVARAIGLPVDVVAQLEVSPAWSHLQALAPSLVYDAVVMRAHPWASAFRGSVTVPTLVLHGDSTWPGLQQAAMETARALPRAHLRAVAGTDHAIVPDAVAAAVRDVRPSVEVDR
ncbi:hypothetical protein PU560_17145 [Georgenia sp. 10Sc9-8]|uniref:Alpha/beta hydrolase n=1 Tax=Georgenia halotolerans TaxID=3028317 RepID=A0ABT5U1G3_9MICO|nr:hypothetical protein [Georgenia halotolerans]